MILGRIILATDGERYSFIKKKWLTKIFVVSDVISFLILATGAFAHMLALESLAERN
jgi:hypothetical protein